MTETDKSPDRPRVATDWWRALRRVADGIVESDTVADDTLEGDTAAEEPKGSAPVRAWIARLKLSRGGARAVLARLRRARGPDDLIAEPAFMLLIRDLKIFCPDAAQGKRPPTPEETRDFKRAAHVARALAHVRVDDRARGVARKLGETGPDAPDPKMSESRLKTLLRTQAGTEAAIAFIRIVRLLDGTVHAEDLARSLWWWGEDKTRRRWAFAYFDGALTEPDRPALQGPAAEGAPTP